MLTLAGLSQGGVLISIVAFFALALYVAFLIIVLSDIIVSRDLPGATKAGWVLLVLIFPVVGMVVYALTHGRGMPLRWFGPDGPFNKRGPLTPA